MDTLQSEATLPFAVLPLINNGKTVPADTQNLSNIDPMSIQCCVPVGILLSLVELFLFPSNIMINRCY